MLEIPSPCSMRGGSRRTGGWRIAHLAHSVTGRTTVHISRVQLTTRAEVLPPNYHSKDDRDINALLYLREPSPSHTKYRTVGTLTITTPSAALPIETRHSSAQVETRSGSAISGAVPARGFVGSFTVTVATIKTQKWQSVELYMASKQIRHTTWKERALWLLSVALGDFLSDASQEWVQPPVMYAAAMMRLSRPPPVLASL